MSGTHLRWEPSLSTASARPSYHKKSHPLHLPFGPGRPGNPVLPGKPELPKKPTSPGDPGRPFSPGRPLFPADEGAPASPLTPFFPGCPELVEERTRESRQGRLCPVLGHCPFPCLLVGWPAGCWRRSLNHGPTQAANWQESQPAEALELTTQRSTHASGC